MNDVMEEDPIALFKRVEKNLTEATASMERLASEQDRRCQTISDAAEKASNLAVEASEAFAVSKPRLMIWTALCAALLVSGGWLAAFWVGRHDGWAAGQVAGRQEALTANAAASWANTASGKMAKRLDDIGNLQPLATCNVPGFSIRKGEKGVRWCVVAGTDGQFHGWAMP